MGGHKAKMRCGNCPNARKYLILSTPQYFCSIVGEFKNGSEVCELGLEEDSCVIGLEELAKAKTK